MALRVDKTVKAFGGTVYKLSHDSHAVGTSMRVNVFLPSRPDNAPVLFYLAGLTCTPDTGLEKGGFLPHAESAQLAIVFPDTSPRTSEEQTVPLEHDDWDLGSGAGFYIDALREPWNTHYRMESYVMEELPRLLRAQFGQLNWSRRGVFGHSMGGHGALTLFLKHPGVFQSVSAFAPIANPTRCAWGQKAFQNYLGSVDEGRRHDATELVRGLGERAPAVTALIDVGSADQFNKDGQLLVDHLAEAAEGTPFEVTAHIREGYDHSYFFVSTFAKNHIAFHAAQLR